TVKLPSGKVIIPGVITHASNIVEHPELIAERITRFAKLVGRENVIAGGDCGFSSQATYNPEVHPTVVWAKFQAMAEGARPASQQLGRWRELVRRRSQRVGLVLEPTSHPAVKRNGGPDVTAAEGRAGEA